MKLRGLAVLGFAAFVAQPVQAEDQACFRNTQTGYYKTFSKSDLVPDNRRWQSVHSGKCTKCEGKNVLDCQEPGDAEAKGLSHKR